MFCSFQRYNEKLRQLEAELRAFQSSSKSPSLHTYGSSPTHGSDTLTRDKYGKEVLILRKTVEEMELRIETQKQTLAARDESIKKLLEMLQSKGGCDRRPQHVSVYVDKEGH